MFRKPFYLVIFALMLAACKKGDELPVFVRIDQVELSTDITIQYSNAHDIRRNWVFVNDEAVGVWPIPGKIPVLGIGSKELKVIAGVRRNGNASEYVQYPFYATWSTTVDLTPAELIFIDPVFEYFTGVSFWNESFEDTGIAFLAQPASDTTIQRVTDPMQVFEGAASGVINLDADRPYFRAATQEDFNIRSSQPVYLEMNYRSDHLFVVGTYVNAGGTVVQIPYIYIVPTADSNGNMPWKKIYIDLSKQLAIPGLSERDIYIEAQLIGQSTAQIWLDNVKLVYYEP